MNNSLVVCLLLALSLNAADAMAAPAKLRAGYTRSQKALVESNVHHHVKHFLPTTSVNRPPTPSVSRKAPALSRVEQGLMSISPQKFIVAIDAGHGGKDTGAIGANGTLEKNVVYAIACKLRNLILAEPNMTPMMVRKGDTFIGLSRRAEIARNAGADLYISLHADAYAQEDAKGSSVFTLLLRRNERGDFSKNTLKASNRAAGKILVELRKKQSLHYRHVKRARFAVLKSPNIPSTLIETGFISNPDEERNLANRAYQERVARSIFNGVRAYFRATGPLRARNASARPIVVASRQ